MARYAATVTSQHPAADTFSYLATFTNTADWDPGVIAAEQLDSGPVRPGTRRATAGLAHALATPWVTHQAPQP
jgi:Polyketide cyclase / dehydrase and lipid transport